MGAFSNLNIQDILISILVLTFSLSVHEYAHARVAYALGDDTAEKSGRLTLNPMAHLDPMGALLFIFARIGYAKPVPVNPARFTKTNAKQGMVWVSLAGPMSNLLIAFVASFLFHLLQFGMIQAPSVLLESIVFNTLLNIFAIFFHANIWLAIFNMLPVPPLDGYKIFGSFLPNRIYYQIMRYERYVGLIFFLLIYFGGGIIGRVMSTLAYPITWLFSVPFKLLFGFV